MRDTYLFGDWYDHCLYRKKQFISVLYSVFFYKIFNLFLFRTARFIIISGTTHLFSWHDLLRHLAMTVCVSSRSVCAGNVLCICVSQPIGFVRDKIPKGKNERWGSHGKVYDCRCSFQSSGVMAESPRYKDKVTVVTGGSRGIGRGCVEVFGELLNDHTYMYCRYLNN